MTAPAAAGQQRLSDTNHVSCVDDIRLDPRSCFCCRGNIRRSNRVSHRPTGHIPKSRSLVCRPRQTVIQSAQLGLCPGLDDALCADGNCPMAHPPAAGGIRRAPVGADLVFRTARA